MDKDEMLEQTNETENDETLTSEENEEMEGADASDENELDSLNEDNTQNNNSNLEQSSGKTFTQDELNSIVQERVRKANNASRRNENNIRNEYEGKLADMENLLNAAFGTNNLDEGLNRITELCEQKGIEIPKRKNQYSKGDLEILANATVQDIINDGDDAVDNELSRLTKKGTDKMSDREKLVYLKLDEQKKKLDAKKELKSIGAKDEILNDSKFIEFADKFAGSKFSMKEIYGMYIKEYKPKEKAEPIGSMKNPNPKEKKRFITEAEYDKMTEKEIEENMDIIRESMPQW